MHLQETPEDLAFRAEVRAFVEANLPADIRDRVLGFRRVEREDYVRWQKILHARGWGAPGWPKEYGGTGWNARQRTIFEEECFTAGAPRQMPFGLSMVGAGAHGVRQRRAEGALSARRSFRWTSGGARATPSRARVRISRRSARARRSAAIDYVVNGQKTWTSFAHWATWIFCLVRTSTEGKPQQGISFLLIDMKTPGVRVKPIRTLDQGHDVNEVFLDDVEVPVENRVGEENQGWTIAKYLLGHERTNIAGIGMCKRLLRRLKEYARTELKRGKPLIEDARFRDRIARFEIEVLSHEWSLMRMISLEQAGKRVDVEASMLKIRGSEIQQDLGELLMECAGPYALPYVPQALELDYTGPTAGGAHLNGLAAQYFDLRKVAIYGGTNEVQKNLIAKSILSS